MTTIITHLDADGVCSASLVRMVKEFHNSYVYFSHPAGLLHDLRVIPKDDLIICDIALDQRSYLEIFQIFEEFTKEYSIIYIDHHAQPEGMPNKVINVHDPNVSATELTYRYFYHQLPKRADFIALLGSICDYLDDSPLMQRLMHHYERRTLFLDAGLLAQGLKKYGKKAHYEKLRDLIKAFSHGKSPCDIPELTQAAINATKSDNSKRSLILSLYHTEKNIAWIQDPPSMSYSKIAHWIMGDSGKHLGLAIRTLNSKRLLVDITIRGWRKIDLRKFIPEIAMKLGGSAGGHANAVGVRLPQKKCQLFLRMLDNHPIFSTLEPIAQIDDLIPLSFSNNLIM
ncbi:MAG: DHH family phosphoesterase [Candidatus Lokiarchaeota archaeon]|nr:DHH family phosphoesterase [Candidatus Harpocratesius repetitus]